jgi:hypothetical protein
MKSARALMLILGLIMAFVAASCAAPQVAAPSPAVSPPKADLVDRYAAGEATSSGLRAEDSATVERMIVRTASLSIVVSDAELSLASIKAAAAELGGYVVDAQLWRDNDQLRGTVTIRVPSESLDEALQRVKGMAVKVERETASSQDVTEAYSDLNAQLVNLEATEVELRELLATVRERTGKAEDILAVHRELSNIRGQIEQVKGRMQYLERTAAMAAMSVELIPDVLAQPIAGTGWRPSATIAEALRSLWESLRFLVDAVLVVLFYIVPLVLVLGVPFVAAWLVWRRWRARRQGSVK